jgi:hypothetical protein
MRSAVALELGDGFFEGRRQRQRQPAHRPHAVGLHVPFLDAPHLGRCKQGGQVLVLTEVVEQVADRERKFLVDFDALLAHGRSVSEKRTILSGPRRLAQVPKGQTPVIVLFYG